MRDRVAPVRSRIGIETELMMEYTKLDRDDVRGMPLAKAGWSTTRRSTAELIGAPAPSAGGD